MKYRKPGFDTAWPMAVTRIEIRRPLGAGFRRILLFSMHRIDLFFSRSASRMSRISRNANFVSPMPNHALIVMNRDMEISFTSKL